MPSSGSTQRRARPGSVKTGEKLFKFLASLILRIFYGTVIIRFESGKVTHVETKMRRMWQYRDLPDETAQKGPELAITGNRDIVRAR